jgi:uncharacterized protein
MAAGTGAAALLGVEFWRGQLALAGLTAGTGPYGPLQAPDANGIQLPAGFVSRVIARTGQTVSATAYTWHTAPDGGACFVRPGGGWTYVSNAEAAAAAGGGASAVQFDATGSIVDAYRILGGTTRNCAGGATPWGTWLSCEENGATGQVYECDPHQAGQGTARPALGSFNHEAAAVDPATGRVYLTEDDPNGRLYRFTPSLPNDLTAGALEAAQVSGQIVTWVTTTRVQPDRNPTTTAFKGGEGAAVFGGALYFTTKGDNRVWELDLGDGQLSVLYDAAATPAAPLTGVDNVTAHHVSGDLLVCEDGGNMEICVIGPVNGVPTVAPFLRLNGHDGSELAGAAFSPDGTRLYFSSQRGINGAGITYEVRGPFRSSNATPVPTTTTTTTTTTTSTAVSTGPQPSLPPRRPRLPGSRPQHRPLPR